MRQPIKIGMLCELTGSHKPYGEGIRDGAHFALQQMQNDRTLAYPIELIVLNTESRAETAKDAFRCLATEHKVAAIIGPASSDLAIAIKGDVELYQVPTLLHMAGSERAIDRSNRFLFRTVDPTIPVAVRGLAEFVQKNALQSVSAIVGDYSAGASEAAALEKYVRQPSLAKVLIEVTSLQETDFRPPLQRLKAQNADAILLAGHPTGTLEIMRSMRELDFVPRFTIGSNHAYSAYWQAIGPHVFKGLVNLTFYDPTNDDYLRLAERYVRATGKVFEGPIVAGYLHFAFLASMISTAGSADRISIRNAISAAKFQTPFMIFPFSYTPWGELDAARVAYFEFTSGGGSYSRADPSAKDWSLRVRYVSPPMTAEADVRNLE